MASAVAYVIGRLVVLILFTLVLGYVMSLFLSGRRLVWTASLLAFALASVSLFAKVRGTNWQEFLQHTAALTLCAMVVVTVWLWAQQWIEARHG